MPYFAGSLHGYGSNQRAHLGCIYIGNDQYHHNFDVAPRVTESQTTSENDCFEWHQGVRETVARIPWRKHMLEMCQDVLVSVLSRPHVPLDGAIGLLSLVYASVQAGAEVNVDMCGILAESS